MFYNRIAIFFGSKFKRFETNRWIFTIGDNNKSDSFFKKEKFKDNLSQVKHININFYKHININKYQKILITIILKIYLLH